MHAHIVFCHPESGSFTGALKDVAIQKLQALGHSVSVSDLHAEGFDPVERAEHYALRKEPDWFSAMIEQRHASNTDTLPGDVLREIERLEKADLVILQFPLWWHSQPAMLKGWFDRVFVSGKTYTSGMRYDRGYFKGRNVICCVPVGAPEAAFGGGGRGGDVEAMFWPIHYSLYYMGFTVLPPFLAYGIQNYAGVTLLDDEAFRKHLEDYKAKWADQLEHLGDLKPIKFPGWNDWDELGHQKT
ncbi:NAD(P)H-dependent oxidoreductase [uncultured Litoreibacter sp.]|uniref:NAD(P)H-dependent oxidoreductase n=1 Tax=uncultured Litoreibacter sp. TaxID=1392394 RepID=UPI002601F0AF|nr:NAD(P)H-dependent oxidoreductase [uncultured Litoreibacter sp.]